MNRSIVNAVVISSTLIVSGCMSFRGGLDDLPKTPTTTAAKAGAQLGYELHWTSNGTANVVAQEQMRPHVESELRDSSLFSQVQQGAGGAYHLDVSIENSGNIGVALLTGALSGLTLTILPGYAHDEYTMTAVLTKGGQKVKSYKYTADVTTWIELFLVFGMPFRESEVIEKTVQNMTRHLVADLAADHLVTEASQQ